MYFALLNITIQNSSCDISIIFILFTVTITHGKFQFLADKPTLGKASSELNEVVETALSIGCRKLLYMDLAVHAVFCKQRFFSAQPQCCLKHITIIILRYILYLVYLCPCLGFGLFMSYICDLFFIFSLAFIIINPITSLKQTHLFFAHFLEYLLLLLDDNVYEESE